MASNKQREKRVEELKRAINAQQRLSLVAVNADDSAGVSAIACDGIEVENSADWVVDFFAGGEPTVKEIVKRCLA
jgi:isopentenyl diphosphate isomerase/L-lactate dehydrogenase-like FMN-dependent dehydrogenase